jgi:acyl carrier protein
LDAERQVRSVLAEVFAMPARAAALRADTPLRDALPELDSMAAVSVVTLLEERLGFVSAPGELTGADFDTLGSLVAFVERKLAEA